MARRRRTYRSRSGQGLLLHGNSAAFQNVLGALVKSYKRTLQRESLSLEAATVCAAFRCGATPLMFFGRSHISGERTKPAYRETGRQRARETIVGESGPFWRILTAHCLTPARTGRERRNGRLRLEVPRVMPSPRSRVAHFGRQKPLCRDARIQHVRGQRSRSSRVGSSALRTNLGDGGRFVRSSLIRSKRSFRRRSSAA